MKSRSICLLLFLALGSNAYAQAPNLQTAGSFGVLAGAGIISPDAGTTVVGNVGSAPTPTVSGLLAAQVNGTLYTAANAAVTQAQTDLTAAYLDAAGRSSCTALTGALGTGTNPTLGPGVYCYSSAALLNGTLTLTGTATDVWIFQIGSTLTTATGATVVLAGGASPCNVFWQVGTSATIQTGNTFAGNIMALTSVTLNGGTLSGRALARNGSVTISGKETIISGCSGAETVLLSPATASVICGAGSTITETAVVLTNGNPVANADVLFTITGADAALSGSVVTDASGTAKFTVAPTAITASSGDTFVASTSGGDIVSNTTTASCSAQGSPPFPSVTVLTVNAGPPKQVGLSVQALGGLFSVVVNTSTNATVSVPAIDRGSTQAIGVTATKINQSASAEVELTVTDLLGHTTTFDPVSATITIPASKFYHIKQFDFHHWEIARFDGIGHTEGKVLLQNDVRGVDFLVIRVNGFEFTTHLSGGETKRIDISSALIHGTNTVSVAAFGEPGGSVDLTISDGN
jgi:Ice-binding-like